MNTNTINWKDYFMNLALLSAKRSKDPVTKVGCVIVNKDNRIVGIGYNGFPLGNDQAFPWTNDSKNISETKYPYVIHAEMNCLLNTTLNDLSSCTLYTTLFPCSDCLKHIIQKKIKYIMYLNDPSDINSEDTKAALNMIQKLVLHVQKFSGCFYIKI